MTGRATCASCENIIDRSVALATRPLIRLDDPALDLALHEGGRGRGGAVGEGPGPLTLREARDRFEQAYVLRALERENWNQTRAARSLGVHSQHAPRSPRRLGHPPRRRRHPLSGAPPSVTDVWR